MSWKSLVIALVLSVVKPVGAEPLFTVTDITSWDNTQLQTLPVFDRYVPFDPAGVQLGFDAAARSGERYAGVYDGAYGAYAGLVSQGAQTNYPPLGVYYWSYSTCDSRDCHFYNGRVGFSHFFDINSSGVAVGDSTLAGTGSSSLDYVSHALVTNPQTGEVVDITPTASRAEATGVNNAGQIVGWQRSEAGHQAFRRSPDGAMTVLDNFGGSVWPTAINEAGVVIGDAIDAGVSYFNTKSFVCEAGSSIQQLALPTQGGVEFSTATDLNNTGWITGHSWKAGAPTERFASLWTKEQGGAYTPFDLNELTDGGDFILERGLAVNDEGQLLVQGKLDQDGSPVHYYLLTPESLLTPPIQAPGDFDFNGVVDGADYLQWRLDYGNTIDPVGSGADGNADGVVDAADYTVWRDHLPSPVLIQATPLSVPEPLALWGVALLGGILVMPGRRPARIARERPL